ncbi:MULTISPECIES: hypothetical protein [unclassified Methanoregula]|uniref:hypothetical protein n=1 Tax=unclassified Methanoregula TaxID=2649730 RepID=UPI0025DE0DB5|nr:MULTISPECIES: hypothetical protein [unclassified Methanoregula]
MDEKNKKKWFRFLPVIGLFLFAYLFSNMIAVAIPFFEISLIFQIITAIFTLIICIWAYVGFNYISKNENKPTAIIKVFILFLVIWLVFQISLISGLHFEYAKTQDYYSKTYTNLLETHSNDKLTASWSLTKQYYQLLIKTYGKVGSYIPNRNAGCLPFSLPLYEFYMNSLDGYQKMIIVQQKGNCGEFTQSIAFLLNDTTKFPTRMVIFEGLDHMMPEIEIDDQWWVFDLGYLTQEKPVRSNDLASYISKNDSEKIAYMYPISENTSLLRQHGFNQSNITITSYAEAPGSVWDGKPIKGVTIEVFAVKYGNDPLVSKGVTDQNGQFSTILNSDKQYVLIGSYEPLPLFPKYKGVALVSPIVSDNLSINVNVTNYS